MRMIEANLFPVIPYLHVPDHDQEVMSMSDNVYTGRSKIPVESGIIESRLIFGACYVSFLPRALIARLLPWRKRAGFDGSGRRESIFAEARRAASTIVGASFMGL
jgi:hypothetical protein